MPPAWPLLKHIHAKLRNSNERKGNRFGFDIEDGSQNEVGLSTIPNDQGSATGFKAWPAGKCSSAAAEFRVSNMSI